MLFLICLCLKKSIYTDIKLAYHLNCKQKILGKKSLESLYKHNRNPVFETTLSA